jgi:hypothetical protein
VRRWIFGVLATFGMTAAIAVPLLLTGSGKSHAHVAVVTVHRGPYQVVVEGAPRDINAGALASMSNNAR